MLTYFGSSVLRNISWMVVLSSALGAIFSNDLALKATLLPLFTGTQDNKKLRSGWGSHDSTGVPDLRCAGPYKGNISRFCKAHGQLYTYPREGCWGYVSCPATLGFREEAAPAQVGPIKDHMERPSWPRPLPSSYLTDPCITKWESKFFHLVNIV